jgi:Fe-S cluster assembly protein SufD
VTTAFAQETETMAATGMPAGPAWLQVLRRQAMDRFAQLGFPTTRNEDWRFTSVAPIAKTAWKAAGANGTNRVRPADIESARLGVPGVYEMVFVNGRFAPEFSSLEGLPAGVIVTSLAQAWERGPVRQNLAQVARFEEHSFTALNTALMEDGAFITVPRGVRVDAPIHLLFLAEGSGGAMAAHPRNLILAGESSELVVVESYEAIGAATYFTNAVTEVVVGANARVEHLKLQRESESAYHVGTVEARQERDSRFRSFSFALGGALARTNIYSIMAGEGSDCTLNGLYLLHESQHIDHQTRIEHAFPNCTSREVYKGILDGSSHAVFNGKVFVRPEAQKTDGKQTNKNLLLSDRAKVDTKPQLEIFADDVKCTHGATVGSLDPIALFYLESRGLTAVIARRLLTYGFAAEVLSEIDQAPIRLKLERQVFDRLETAMR